MCCKLKASHTDTFWRYYNNIGKYIQILKKITKLAERHFYSLKTYYLYISQNDIRKIMKASNTIDNT